MKKIALFLFALLFAAVSLTGCAKYTSHYSVVLHACSNDSDSAQTTFYQFKGSEVFKFKCGGETVKIQYSGKLETGSMTVYYDCGSGKTELFSIHAGEELAACSDPFTAGTLYIITEANEKCESGDFSFEIIPG